MKVCALLPNADHSTPKRPTVPHFGKINSKLRSKPKTKPKPQTESDTLRREPNPHPHTDFGSWYGCGFVCFGILRKSQQLNTRTSERVILGQSLEANEGSVRVSCHEDEANLNLLIWSILTTNINFGREKNQEMWLRWKKTDFLWQQFKTTQKFDNFHTTSAPNALCYWPVADNFCTADNNSQL